LAGDVARILEKRHAYRLLEGTSEGKRPSGRPRCRSVDNIKIDIEEGGWGGMDWICLIQDKGKWGAVVITVMNLRVQKKSEKFLSA
jgi:hypothetical protein